MTKESNNNKPIKEKIFVDSTTLELPFPPQVLAEAKEISETGEVIIKDEIKNRRDFRDVTTFTIDPLRARDFDDALSIQELENGSYEVGVHIADVSFYVRPGTLLEREAANRATSVYLIDRVLPMLPHELSDDLCSLKQGVDRLTFSAVFTLDNEANILSEWFGRTVIHSDRRFTYEEVEALVATRAEDPEQSERIKKLERSEGKNNNFVKELTLLRDFADKLDKKKIKAGALAFEEDEYAYEVDAEGKPISIIKEERLKSHKLVEDFMLLANKQVAERASKIIGNRDHAFVYRVHDQPDSEKLQDFMRFVKLFGHSFKNQTAKITPLALNNFLKTLAGSPDEAVINDAAVRSMSRATYSTKNIGHFGLAFKYYTHFTSPIRRYPDLLVHRLFDHYLKNEKVPAELLENLDKLCTNSSEREQFATVAERDSIKLAQCRYLADRADKTYDGVIAWIAEFGLFIEELSTGARGLVHVTRLPDDYYIFNEKTMSLVGKRTKQSYRLGEQVKIRVTSSDPEARLINFEIV